MMRRPRRQRRSAGQSLVEFALVFPIFLLVLAGIIDFGIGLYSYMTVQNATREGARLAVTNCNGSIMPGGCDPSIASRVYANSNGLLTSGSSTVTVSCTKQGGGSENCNASAPGDSVQVSTHYDYHMIWPLTFGTVIGMDSSVTFMIE